MSLPPEVVLEPRFLFLGGRDRRGVPGSRGKILGLTLARGGFDPQLNSRAVGNATETSSHLLLHESIKDEDVPAAFTWGDVNGTSYLTMSRNQHIPPRVTRELWGTVRNAGHAHHGEFSNTVGTSPSIAARAGRTGPCRLWRTA